MNMGEHLRCLDIVLGRSGRHNGSHHGGGGRCGGGSRRVRGGTFRERRLPRLRKELYFESRHCEQLKWVWGVGAEVVYQRWVMLALWRKVRFRGAVGQRVFAGDF
jgi:hypothetical protein